MESVINVKINENDEIEYLNIEETEEVYETDDEDGEGTVLVPNGDGVMSIRRKSKTVVEHVCGKCEKSYKTLPALKRHLNLCRHQPIPTARLPPKIKVEKERNLKSTTVDGSVKENECFCCYEDKTTAHIGCIACNFCPKSFKSHIQLERHLFTLHSPCTLFACTICNATCPSPEILELHVASHEEGKPFSCQKCGKEFTRKYHLDRHLEYTSCDETREKKMLPCKVCNKEFSRLDNLREHLRVHLGNPSRRKDYECPFCEKSFYGSSLLNIHIRTHTGERPFPCDLCDDTFPSNGALRKHRRRHTGEKPYQCSVCPKAFSVKETLNRHMKIHTGNKPHVCAVCSMAFIQATQLRNHMARHSAEQFPCPICPMEFISAKRLEKHKAKFHTDSDPTKSDKFQCDVCQCTFRLKSRLALHLRKHIRKAAAEQRRMNDANGEQSPKRKYTKRVDAAAPVTVAEIKIEKDVDEYLPVAKKPRGRPRKVATTADRAVSPAGIAEDVPAVVATTPTSVVPSSAPAALPRIPEEAEHNAVPVVDSESVDAVAQKSPTAAHQVSAEASVARRSNSAENDSPTQSTSEKSPVVGGPFQCDRCPRQFALNRYLQVHMKAHDRREDGPFRCKVCKMELRSLTCLTAHMRQAHFQTFMSMMMDTPGESEAVQSLSEPTSPTPLPVILNVSSSSSKSPLPIIQSVSSSSPKSQLPIIHSVSYSSPNSSLSVIECASTSPQQPILLNPKPVLLNSTKATKPTSPVIKPVVKPATPPTKPLVKSPKPSVNKSLTSPNRPLTVTIKSEKGPGGKLDAEYEVEIIDMKEEQDDEVAEEPTGNLFDIPISLSASELTDNVAQLLTLLVDEQTLTELGWPNASCEDVLAEVISQCGQTPADRVTCPDYETVMRENAKLLFTSVINNDSIKSLLNNNTVDEVIMHVLKLAS